MFISLLERYSRSNYHSTCKNSSYVLKSSPLSKTKKGMIKDSTVSQPKSNQEVVITSENFKGLNVGTKTRGCSSNIGTKKKVIEINSIPM